MNANVALRVKLFQLVRDIPYRIGLSPEEQDYCCATKTPLLQTLLAEKGIKSRRMCCRFLWKETKFSRVIIAKSNQPDCLHEFIEVYVPEKKKWVAVDPTWDIALKKTGLPVAKWNGMSATALAVRPAQKFSPKESAALLKQIEQTPPKAMKEFYKRNRAFFNAINNWLEKNRHYA